MPVEANVRYEAIDVSTVAVGLTITPANGVRPNAAEITVEEAAVRYLIDGNDPTAASGVGVEEGGVIALVDFGELKRFRAIRKDGADAKLQVHQGLAYIP